MLDIVKPVVLGLLFGWSLHKAGLTHYARIVNVYRFRDLTVMRYMLTALLVGGIAIQAGVELGMATHLPIPATTMLANVVGGMVFGVGMATAGVAPRIMGIGPAPATRRVLDLTGLKLDQLDVIELNEAFAAQGLAVLRELGLADDDPRVNPNGGAIALGHPLAPSG